MNNKRWILTESGGWVTDGQIVMTMEEWLVFKKRFDTLSDHSKALLRMDAKYNHSLNDPEPVDGKLEYQDKEHGF